MLEQTKGIQRFLDCDDILLHNLVILLQSSQCEKVETANLLLE